MDIVWRVAVILLVIGLIKLEWRIFRKLTSPESMEDGIEKGKDAINNAADKVAGYWKSKKDKKKEQPIVTIR